MFLFPLSFLLVPPTISMLSLLRGVDRASDARLIYFNKWVIRSRTTRGVRMSRIIAAFQAEKAETRASLRGRDGARPSLAASIRMILSFSRGSALSIQSGRYLGESIAHS